MRKCCIIMVRKICGGLLMKMIDMQEISMRIDDGMLMLKIAEEGSLKLAG